MEIKDFDKIEREFWKDSDMITKDFNETMRGNWIDSPTKPKTK